jgi:hypothetical protein
MKVLLAGVIKREVGNALDPEKVVIHCGRPQAGKPVQLAKIGNRYAGSERPEEITPRQSVLVQPAAHFRLLSISF